MPNATRSDQEKQVLHLMRQIRREKKALKDSGAGRGVLSEFDEAEAYAAAVVRHLRNKDIDAARNLWVGAQALFVLARRSGSTFVEFKNQLNQVLNVTVRRPPKRRL